MEEDDRSGYCLKRDETRTLLPRVELSAHETKRERKGEKRQKRRKMGLLEKRADQTETGNEREERERERESTIPRIEQRKTVSFRKIQLAAQRSRRHTKCKKLAER